MNAHLTIDGQSCEVEKGFTILQAAHANQINIPTLCDCPGLPTRGSCRMCVVEIQGRTNTPTACTVLAEEGMVVLTRSPKVQALRGDLLQMLLADHPSSCLFCPEQSHCDECMVTLRKSGVTTGCRSCPKDGQCELQALAQDLGLTQANYPGRYRMLKVERNDPFFDRDYNLCVLCGRCVRTCESLHFSSIINYTKRGAETVIGTAFGRTHLEAGCSFCGACVEICPTGALTEKTRKWDGAPDLATPSTCPLCSIGCPISLLSKGNSIIGSLPDHQAMCDELCVLGRFGITELVNGLSRLKRPQLTTKASSIWVSWGEAIQHAAEKLQACRPERFEMVVSSNLSNETLYVAQKFCRTAMHSENIHSPALDTFIDRLDLVVGLIHQSQPISILRDAGTIVCLGFDGTYSQSVVEVELHRARQRGTRIISINAKHHSPGRQADLWLRSIHGKESELLEKLEEKFGQGKSNGHSGTDGFKDQKIEKVAQALSEAKNPVFIVGQSYLDYPDQRLLKSVQRLIDLSSGLVITLPIHSNLTGALAMGILPAYAKPASQIELLYVIGESIPVSVPKGPDILYQNIYPPLPDQNADLVLPVASFSEEDGSLIDSAGVLREMRQAVNPPGEAMPSWKILCEIAQRMGVPGFKYESAAEIRNEIAEKIGNFTIDHLVSWPALAQFECLTNVEDSDGSESIGLVYMGYPLTERVAGLKSLIGGEPHV